MSLVLYRIDDRLIHGQVVVGWGQPLNIAFIVLVDEDVAGSEWERELYRMGVPPEMELFFHGVEEAASKLTDYEDDPRRGILLTRDIATMTRLASLARVSAVNLGGLHHRAGRIQRLRYVFLDPAEESELRALAQTGVDVTAQDVPGTRPIPLGEVLSRVET